MVECHKEALNGLNHLNNQTIHCIGQYFVYEKQDDRLSRRIKTELENRVNEIDAENLNEEAYTEDSWEALQDALETAENVLNDTEATQADVDAALAALNEARAGLEEVGTSPISANSMKERVERLAAEGAFESDSVARSLTLHLTAVGHYEQQEQAEKVVKHMESFEMLPNHQKENALISDEAYNALKADTESVKPKMAIA